MLTHGFGNTCDPVSTCTGPTLIYYMFYLEQYVEKIIRLFVQTKYVWTEIRSSQWYEIIIIGNIICMHLQQKICLVIYFCTYIVLESVYILIPKWFGLTIGDIKIFPLNQFSRFPNIFPNSKYDLETNFGTT